MVMILEPPEIEPVQPDLTRRQARWPPMLCYSVSGMGQKHLLTMWLFGQPITSLFKACQIRSLKFSCKYLIHQHTFLHKTGLPVKKMAKGRNKRLANKHLLQQGRPTVNWSQGIGKALLPTFCQNNQSRRRRVQIFGPT